MKEIIRNNRIAATVVFLVTVLALLLAWTSINGNQSATLAPSNAEVEVMLGSGDAVNSMVVYLDPLCDRCQQFYDEVISELNDDEVKKGELAIFIRPLSMSSSVSSRVNEVALCSNTQGKFLEAMSVIGEQIHTGDDEFSVDNNARLFLRNDPAKLLSDKAGIDKKELTDCIDNNQISYKLSNQDDLAKESGIHSTPSIYINKSEPIKGYAQIGYVRSQLIK